jgi:ribosomal protein S10
MNKKYLYNLLQNLYPSVQNKYKYLAKISLKNTLKKKKKIYTTIRSTHVFKKSMEHFSWETYQSNINLHYEVIQNNKRYRNYVKTYIVHLLLGISNDVSAGLHMKKKKIIFLN